MNILILSDDIKTSKATGANIRLLKLIKYISRDYKEVKFDIYTTFTDENNIIDLPNCDIHYIKSKIYSYIIRTFPKRNNILKKIIWRILTYPGTTDYLWIKKALSEIIRNKDKKKYDLILLQVPSYLNVIYGSILKNKLKIPLIYDLRDDLINFKNTVGIKCIEKRMVRSGDKIVCVTEGSLNNMKNKYKFYSSKFFYIPNGYDFDDMEFRKEIKVKSSCFPKIVVYTGVIDKNRFIILDTLFQILKQLKNIVCDISEKLIIIFYTKQNNIHSLIKKYDLNKFVYVNDYIIDPKIYYSILMNADMLLSMNFNTPFSIPGKLYEYLILNDHVVHIDNSMICNEVLKYFPKSNLILFDNINEIKNIINQLLSNNENTIQKINTYSIPAKFIKIYNREEIAKRYFKLMDSLK